MTDYTLGSARGRIVIESDTKGLDDTETKVKGVGNTTEAALGKVGRTAGIAGAAVAGGLAVAVKTAADFEKGLSGIAAVSSATPAEMEKVRAKALQIGADTAFSASEASSAMEELVKAGISIPDTLNGAADAVVALAAAGGVDLPTAATIASNSMNQFNLKADQMTGVVDKISGAANASAIDVGDFGMSLSQVGAVANLAGLSFDDTAVAIAEMGNAGIKGSDAGTSLKTMLMNLQPQTDKQKDLMKELGLITKDGTNAFYDQAGKLKPLKDIQGTLSDALKGMSQAQKQAALETIFGSDAIRAAAVFANEGAAGYDKMNTAIDKTSAADVAKTRLDNFAGSMEQLKGSAETLAIGIGSVLIPIVRTMVDGLTQAVNWFNSLDQGTKDIVVKVAAIAAGFLLFGAGLIKVVSFAKEFYGALKTIGTAMQLVNKETLTSIANGAKQAAMWVVQTAKMIAHGVAMAAVRVATLAWTAAQWLLNAALNANPISLIIIAVIALVAAIIWLWNNNEGFRNFVIAAWEGIKNAVKAVVDWFVNTAWPFLQKVWDGIVQGVQAVADFFVNVWNGIKAFVGLVFQAIATIITTYINIWRTIITTVLNVIKTVFEAIWNGIKTVISTVVSVITTVITTYINIWKAIITTVMNAIKAVISAVWAGIQAVIRTVVNLVIGYINLWRNLISIVVNIFTRIKDGASNILTALVGFIKGIPGKILSALGNLGSLLLNAGKKIIEGLLNGIKDKFEAVKNFVSGIGDWIASHKGPISYDVKLLVPNGKAIMTGLRKGISSQIPPLTADLRAVSDAANRAVTARAVTDRRLAQPALGASPQAAGGSVGGGTNEANINIEINNPVPERASESMYRAAQRMAWTR